MLKIGLGLYRKLRLLYTNYNLFRFWLRKAFFGFDVANHYMQRLDKQSIQLILTTYGASIGVNCDIETGLTFHNCNDYTNLQIGNNCHIGKNCFFDMKDKVVIGNNVTISMQCTFITHQDMGKSALDKDYGKYQGPITIKHNVYIGVNSTILKGVKVEESSIIAAGSLVKDNVESKIIFGGVPAIFIKKIE